MRRRAAAVGLAIVVSPALTGCGAAPTGCSEVGGFDGLSVLIAPRLSRDVGSVRVELCDDAGCSTTSEELRPPRRIADPSRSVSLAWSAFDHRPDDGPVEVTVEVLDESGDLTASAVRTVDLAYAYPNGRACDGDRYLNGLLRVRPGVRVPSR